MLELSLAEMALIAVIALIVVGPQDLPKVLRAGMKLMRQARGMWRDVQQSIESVVDETGVRESFKDVKDETKYIIDQNGEYQRVYDISDLLEEEELRPQLTHEKPDQKKDAVSE